MKFRGPRRPRGNSPLVQHRSWITVYQRGSKLARTMREPLRPFSLSFSRDFCIFYGLLVPDADALEQGVWSQNSLLSPL